MRKHFVSALVFAAFTQATAAEYNSMIIDSSFVPTKLSTQQIGDGECLWIDENNREIPEKGECYDKAAWESLKSADGQMITGYLDSMISQKTSASASYWQLQLQANPSAASQIKNGLKLLTHGSRSALLLDSGSQGVAKPLLVRNVSTQVGSVKTASSIKAEASAPKYTNGCGLPAWSDKDLSEFIKEKRVLPYQERIAKALELHPSIQVISISLGYKHSWIAEDNPKCEKNQVAREYLVLQASWKNLLNRFSERLFVTAIGNEAEDFSQASFRNNDLWGLLSDSKNLLLVGSLDEDNKRAKFSNFGIAGMLWAKGAAIPIQYPVPGKTEGYPSQAHGTSASAPLAAGKIIFSHENKKQSLSESVQELRASSQPKTWDFQAYQTACQNHDEKCLQAIKGLLAEGQLWGNLQNWYKKIQTDWHPSQLEIRFSDQLKNQGRQLIERQGKWMVPVIELAKSDPFEMLITLNHEMYHVISLESHIAALKENEKIKNCMTKYQILRLQDETSAFQQEISFWKDSPPWFKAHFNGKLSSSRLIQTEKISYASYYAELEKRMQLDAKFVVKRYIELGEVSACAAEAIAQSNTH